MNEKIKLPAIEAWVSSHDGWRVEALESGVSAIEKTYQFRTYEAAIGFIMRVALMAERANHHPNMHNLYKLVRVVWFSHSAGGVTALDLDLAARCDGVGEEMVG
jgi:4a-hydroxytetrahydrobiopterin dehydratase